MQSVQVFKGSSDSFLCSHSCRETFYEGSVRQAPFFLNVDYGTGKILNHWVDSLSASFAAVQVREGGVERGREGEREGERWREEGRRGREKRENKFNDCLID
jgi:hypothetical protein